MACTLQWALQWSGGHYQHDNMTNPPTFLGAGKLFVIYPRLLGLLGAAHKSALHKPRPTLTGARA